MRIHSAIPEVVSVIAVPPPRSLQTTLDDVRAGEPVVVEAVVVDGAIGERLLEMGITPGVVVEVVRRAPFGDPLQLRLRGYLLALRSAQARGVRVRRMSAPPA